MSSNTVENINGEAPKREVRSFLMARDPSIDRRYRPRPDRQVRLFDGITEERNEDSDDNSSCYGDSYETDDEMSKESLASALSSGGDGGDGALVYLRLRPVEMPSSVYTVSNNVLIAGPSKDSNSTSNNINMMEKHYSFSAIFESGVGQDEVYSQCISQKIEADENFTILTYGTSGSGKTFTLLGDENRPGIIPRSVENIFTLYAKNIYPSPSLKLVNGRATVLEDKLLAKEVQLRRQMFSACSDIQTQYERQQEIICANHAFKTTDFGEVSVLIWISFVELYNEFVYDLLTPPSTTIKMAAPPRSNLKIVGNDGKVFIKGLTSVYVKNSQEALKLLNYGLQRVTYASTSINANSSRSHFIFFVDVLKYYQTGVITETTYKFCDLAGSERLDKTGNVGSRLKEAQRINASLMVLGRCLVAANSTRKKEVIPFRESKLTMLLQAALLGKEKLTMVVNVTPTDKYYEENINVLGFSAIAKNIIFKQPLVKQNNSRYSFFLERGYAGAPESNRERNEYIEQLLEENSFLHSKLEEQEARHSKELVEQEQALRKELVESFRKTLEENKKQTDLRLQQEIETQTRIKKNEIAAIKRQYEEELEDLREELEEEKENSTEISSKKRRTLN